MNKKISNLITLLIASGLVLSACTAQAASTDLAGSSWALVSYGPAENQTPAAPDIETSINFGEDGTVSGSVGCNSFSGDYEVKSGEIVFGSMISTLMACPEPQMTQEGAAFQVMNGTVSFKMDGGTMTIYDASGALAITLSKIENK